jgi:hypothetical protein
VFLIILRVTAIEVEKGRRWAESRIKSLTGGDKISARFMRQDFFEYKPQFKLLIAGNHKPAIRDVDEAMRRRLHLIPFTVTIPPEKRDKTLSERLLQESDGILKWALDGCLEWQRIGLNPPAVVLSATEEYFESQDAMRRWMEDHCFVHPSVRSTTEDLFSSWKLWAENWGEYITKKPDLTTACTNCPAYPSGSFLVRMNRTFSTVANPPFVPSYRDGPTQLNREGLVEFFETVQKLTDVFPVNELHRDVRLFLFFTKVVELRDVGVIEAHRDFDLGFEHGQKFGIGAIPSLDAFDHEQAPRAVGVSESRAVNLGHAALRHVVEKDVAAKFFEYLCHRDSSANQGRKLRDQISVSVVVKNAV